MQAMAYAIARLAGDHHLQAEIDQRLGSEIAQLPTWLQRLDRIRPTSALQAIDPTFAGANIAVGADLDGHQLTMVGFIDFASVYLALGRGIDPTPIGPIDELKAILA